MNGNYKLINEDEKTVNLMVLCLYVLKKWKIMLAFAVLAGILAGGLFTVTDYKAYKASLSTEQGVETSKKNVSEFVKGSVLSKMETIENYERTIATYEYYYTNSIKVKLDPNHIPQGSHEYLFSAVNSEEMLKAISVCEQELFSDENLEKMIAELSVPTEVKFIKEVIYFAKEYPVAAKLEENVIYGDDEDMLYRVTVRHYNQEDCDKMHAFVYELMESLQGMLDERDINVDVSYAASKQEVRVDRSYPALGKELRSTINSFYDNIETVKNKMSAEEASYYEYLLKENSKTGENAAVNADASIADFLDVKMGVLGAVAGVVCVAGYFVLLYLLGGFVHNKEELSSWLNVPVAEFGADAEMLAVFLYGVAMNHNVKKVYLTGTMPQLDHENLMQISTMVAERGVEVIVGNSILKEGKSLQDATDCGSMILLEKANVSKEKDVKEAIEKAVSCGINVLSVVLEK